MLRIVLVRPGSTDFDEQGRIKGTLDIPLNENGTHQAVRAARELDDLGVEIVYTSPCQSAVQTAAADRRAVQLRRESTGRKRLSNTSVTPWISG